MLKKDYLFFAFEKDAEQNNFIKLCALAADENFKTVDTVCCYFDKTCPSEIIDALNLLVPHICATTILVTWSKQEYLDFAYHSKELGFHFEKNKAVQLQRTLKLFTGMKRGFVKLLNLTNLYDCGMPLDRGVNNVKYLRSLYKLFLNSLRLHKHKVDTRLCIAKGSNIIHNENCHHLRRAVEVCEISPEALFEGYTYCKHCKKKHPLRAYKIDSNISQLSYDNYIDRIYELCDSLSIECNILGGIAFLYTGRAHWRIIFKDTKVCEVLHESYNAFKFHNNSPGDIKFHKQMVKETTMEGVIRYIYHHDKKLPTTIAPKKHLSRMEYLFSVIEGKEPSASACAI